MHALRLIASLPLARFTAAMLLTIVVWAAPASAQVRPIGQPQGVGTAHDSDLAFDPVHRVYAVIGYGGIFPFGNMGKFIDASGTVVGASFDAGAGTPRLAYSPDVSNGAGGFGGFLSARVNGGAVHVITVAYPAGIVGSDTVIADGSGGVPQGVVGIAYSRQSQKFLVAWRTSDSQLQGRFVSAQGTPVSGILALQSFAGSTPALVWNAAADEFGLTYITSSMSLRFCTVRASDGTVGPCTSLATTSSTTVSFSLGVTANAHNYVVVLGATSWAFDRYGTPIATRTLPANVYGLSYNPTTGTLLGLVGGGGAISAVQLNEEGAALGNPMVVTTHLGGPGNETILTSAHLAAESGTARWMLIYSRGIINNSWYSQVVADNVVLPPQPRPSGDFDGDRKHDVAVFRQTTGTWHVLSSAQGYTGSPSTYQWGMPGDVPVAGDFEGDGETDLAVFRPATGMWYIRYSLANYGALSDATYQWGVPGDVPIAGDFDGDGRTDVTVYRPATGTWYIRYSSREYSSSDYGVFQWGMAGDVPLSGDFDGDGRTEIAVWRPENGYWFVRYSSLGYDAQSYGVTQWGAPGDAPLIGDFDGDKKTDIVVWRPASGTWYIRYSTLGYAVASHMTFQWGLSDDVPMAIDLDGDGKTDIAAYRPSTGQWFVRLSTAGYAIDGYAYFQWGAAGDAPVK